MHRTNQNQSVGSHSLSSEHATGNLNNPSESNFGSCSDSVNYSPQFDPNYSQPYYNPADQVTLSVFLFSYQLFLDCISHNILKTFNAAYFFYYVVCSRYNKVFLLRKKYFFSSRYQKLNI